MALYLVLEDFAGNIGGPSQTSFVEAGTLLDGAVYDIPSIQAIGCPVILYDPTTMAAPLAAFLSTRTSPQTVNNDGNLTALLAVAGALVKTQIVPNFALPIGQAGLRTRYLGSGFDSGTVLAFPVGGGGRVMMGIPVNVTLNTLASAVVLTVVKSGVDTAAILNIPAGATGPFAFPNLPVPFADTDTWTIRMDNNAGGVGNEAAIMLSVEWKLSS